MRHISSRCRSIISICGLEQQVFGISMGSVPFGINPGTEFRNPVRELGDLAAATPEADLDFGRKFVRLAESGNVSGFKDLRVVLLWPYWSRVLSEFSELRVVRLTVLRSPHEVAMSIFDFAVKGHPRTTMPWTSPPCARGGFKLSVSLGRG